MTALLTAILCLAATEVPPGDPAEAWLRLHSRSADNAVVARVVDRRTVNAASGARVLELSLEGRSLLNGHPIEVVVSLVVPEGDPEGPGALGERFVVLYRWGEVLPGEVGNVLLGGAGGLLPCSGRGREARVRLPGPAGGTGMPLGVLERRLRDFRRTVGGARGPLRDGKGCAIAVYEPFNRSSRSAGAPPQAKGWNPDGPGVVLREIEEEQPWSGGAPHARPSGPPLGRGPGNEARTGRGGHDRAVLGKEWKRT